MPASVMPMVTSSPLRNLPRNSAVEVVPTPETWIAANVIVPVPVATPGVPAVPDPATDMLARDTDPAAKIPIPATPEAESPERMLAADECVANAPDPETEAAAFEMAPDDVVVSPPEPAEDAGDREIDIEDGDENTPDPDAAEPTNDTEPDADDEVVVTV